MPRLQSTRFTWPRLGMVESTAYAEQPPGTTPSTVNCMAYDPRSGRNRGGSRSGTSKYCPSLINGSAAIQNINAVATLLPFIPILNEDGTLMLNEDGSLMLAEGSAAAEFGERGIAVVAVAGGTVKTFDRDGAYDVTGGTNALSSLTNTIFSTQFFGSLFFADGSSKKYYDSSTNSVKNWTLTDGTFPTDSDSNYPRLICNWGGRIVLSGLPYDSHNWFMSRVGRPLDFDYAPNVIDVQMAVAGNNASAGLNPDVITALIPYNDDTLIFGGDHSIYQLRGNPADGGRIDQITDVTGIAWGEAWCKTPEGILYFVGSRGGLYKMVPGQPPQRMSAMRIDERLSTINMADNSIKLVWDDRHIGVRILISPYPVDGVVQGDATHYFWDARNEGFWPYAFANKYHNPMALFLFDGPDPNDRVVLMGGQDGYVRQVDITRGDDDGETIDSEVTFSPLDSLSIVEMRATMSPQSGQVRWSLYDGLELEQALEDEPVAFGEFRGGRNPGVWPRTHVQVGWFKLSSSQPWSMEKIELSIKEDGRVRTRSI